jgi:PTS system nitrogen regulatory IIA component
MNDAGEVVSMDTLTQWLCPREVELDLDVRNRWEALRTVSALIERSRGLSAPPVFRALWRRERAASTGVGNGLAIPHARVPGIAEPVTVYVRTKSPVDFAAPDGKRVSELFVILVPADGANAKHLRLLALVAEVFSGSGFRAHLAAASDPQDVRSAFSQWIRESQLAATEGSCNSQRAAPRDRTRNVSPVGHVHH